MNVHAPIEKVTIKYKDGIIVEIEDVHVESLMFHNTSDGYYKKASTDFIYARLKEVKERINL